jgi:hypothetical protein
MPRHTDSEIKQTAERFWQLADTLDPATALPICGAIRRHARAD